VKVSVRIEGLRELDAALAELPKATAKNVLVKVLMEAGTPIKDAAQAAAPTRPADAPTITYKAKGGARRVRRPGTLKALFQIGTRLTPNQARLARKEGKDFAEVYVGTRDPIARLEEYGTAHSPPQPTLRRAWDGNKEAALETVKSRLGELILKAAARLAKKRAKAGG
jgi:HK97 gp10 family phage protein